MADEDENVEADPCTVCGDSGDYANDRFIFCDGCDVGFHQSCYGLQEQTFTDSDSEDFYCHYCSQINHNTSPSTKSSTLTKCELCAMDRGDLAIMAVDGDDSMKQFVHVICAYAFKCNQSENGTKVKVNSAQLQDDDDHKSGKCMLCTVGNGFKIGCAHPECTQQVHPSCARIQCNGGNDSFYFDDIYDDRLFRNPMYFCPLHAVQLRTMDPSKRKLRAIKLIKLWNKQKSKRNQRGTKKRKRASKQENADYSDWTPMRKRRKIMNPMESSEDKQTQKTVRNVEDREDERLCTDAMPMEEQGVLHRETTTNNVDEAEEEMDGNQSSLSSSFEALSCDATSTLKESNQDIAQNAESTEDDDVDIKHEDTINDDAFTVMDIHKHPTRSSKHSKSVDIYAALRELNKVREQRREEADGSNQQKKRKKTKNMANFHDFAYCLDKCCCSLCLQPLDDDHDHDAKQESPWFDGALWFNAEYKMKLFGSEEKSKLTASFCRNLRIQMDHSPTFHNDSDRDGNTSQRTTKHEMEPCTVEPFESMAMYNCSAFVDSKGQHQDIAIPQCPLNKEGDSKSTLFYHETYRDIVINGNGAVQCLDICPLNRYHTKNPFNYLAVFADNHQKYHSVAEEQDPEDEREYLIQIWKIRKSQSFAKKAKKQCQGIQSLDTNQWVIAAEKHKNAVFHYGIVHRGGFIWDMKWLPMRIEHKPPESMRTQKDKYQRMGLMAVCSADKMLYIYSMPFIVADGTLLDIQPVVQLSIWNETFTRLSWPCHVTSPLLLAATVSGSVAMWNMEQLSTSELERNEMNVAMYSVEDQQMELVACYDGNDRIVAMDWCSDQEGHFITVSESGCLKLWDLNNLFTPLFTRDMYSSHADLQWIPGLDCAVITGESYGSAGSNTSTKSTKGKNRSSGSCSKLVSLWPLAGKSISRKMGQVVQFPGEKLYAVLNQVARSVDILIAGKCTRHSMSKLVDHTDGVTVYVVVGMSSGSVRFYHQEMAQLVDMKALANGQIMSQLIFDGKSHIEGTNETEADGVECSIRGPFYGITGPVDKKQCDVTRRVWTDEKNDNPVYDPYHVSPKHMALDDSAPIRKVRLCPNEEHLDIVSGSISGIIRIQTVRR